MALCKWPSSGLSCSGMQLRSQISCRRRSLLRVQASLQMMVKVPMASMGALVATSYRLGPHTAVVSTLAQLMVTAVAIASGACLSAQMDHLLRRKDISLEEDEVDGVDITGYKIFKEPEVQKALSFARAAHAGQMRKTGEPYITHCIHTAKILAALVPQEGKRAVDTIVAGLLHDVIDDTAIDLNTLREYFGPDVAKLVAGVSKLSHVNQLLRRHRRTSADTSAMNDVGLTYADVDSLRVMLLGMINDPRVVLIKLADRLHNMRTIYALPQSKACAVAQETLAVWCSLASRLGVWGVKAELEDLCFAVLQPQTFRKLRAKVAELWRPNKDWRYLRRGKKSNYKAMADEKELYADKMSVPEEDENGDSEEEKEEEDEEEERVSMKELLESVIPFDVLMDREKRRRMLASCNKSGVGGRKKSKVLQDAELALTALAACEEALEKELLIATSYVPGMEVTLSGRLKNLYSTYCKIKRKGVEVDKVYDARALRVVVGDGCGSLHVQAVEGCYNLLSVIHSLWTPIAGEFDDYIVNPKPSGYQSLHTAVVGPDRAPLEVQIRTQGMHELAEYGHAAHWLYKEADGSVNPIRSYFALPPINKENENLSNEVTEEEKGLKDTAVTGNSNVVGIPPKLVKSGYPTLKVEGGRLLAAVVLRVENKGRDLLVAVSFSMQAREAVAAGRLGNQRGRWETYARLFKRATDEWWFAPGHGDWSICLEKYTLCQDGIYHKQDQFERSLPAFIQFIELSRQEQKEYWEVMSTVLAGSDVSGSEIYLDSEKALSTFVQDGGSTAARLNNKVRLLRSMLQWEQELRQEVDLDRIRNQDNADSLVLAEVLVIRWPDGEIMRMPHGSSAADAARRMGLDGNFLFVNGQVSLPNTILKDGDIIEIRL